MCGACSDGDSNAFAHHGTLAEKESKKKNTRSRASRFRFKLKNGASQCIGCPNIELAAVPTGAATLLYLERINGASGLLGT